jgi:hypothetical protein
MLARRLSILFSLVLPFAVVPSARAQTAVTTERYDNGRTGANLSETILNTSNVNANQFGKLFSYSVNGSVQAQPLYVPAVNVAGQGVHNVVYIATMNDVLYAFDADSNSLNGGVLWMKDFTNAAAGVTAIPITDIVGNNNLNIVGNVGIESTPVIDLSTNTLYLVARTKEVSGSITNYVARLHAIDITNGAEKFGGPTVIQGSVPGTGNGSSGGQLSFDPKIQNQRSSLALVNGSILFSFASHEDLFAWHGWIFSYNAQTLQQNAIFCSSPNGLDSGIWMAGRAPAIDANGNAYYVTGNGDYIPGSSDFGDTVLKMSTAGGGLSVADWFTPDDYQNLQSSDLDLGSTGPVLIPGTDLLVTSGKESIVYVMHTGNMGHEQSGNNQIVQHFTTTGGEVKGGLVFWNRHTGAGPTMYVWADNIALQAYQFNGSTFATNPISQSTILAAPGSSGGVLSISANGSTVGTGIVWSSMPLTDDGDHGVHQGVLRAFDANDLTNELWDSTMNANRDGMGLWPKFSPPMVANGKVYMASFSNVVNVYGLLSSAPDFSISAAPNVQSVAPAGSTAYSVSTTAINGLNSAINLSVTGLPAGATGSFAPSSVSPSGSSTLTVNTASATPIGTYPLTISGTAGGTTHSATVYLNVATAGLSSGVISIDFVGEGTAMASSEQAGVISKANWNNALGASGTPLALVDENNNLTSATVTWNSDNIWALPITDSPGNARMMRGYLDTGKLDPTTVTVNNLPLSSAGYNIYVYTDGDNNSATRSASYQITGTGITTTTVNATDPGNSNFSGTFTQASNSNGNYVLFTGINANSFTITATPGAASDGTARAPLNGIQIVPLGQSGTADFSVSANPSTISIVQGGNSPVTIGTAAANGFSGTVNLSVTGLPTGATASFNPASVAAGSSSTLNITVASSTAVGSYPLTVSGTSGALTHTAALTLNVTTASSGGAKVISIQFVGAGVAMTASEVAGVVPEPNWNAAKGGTPSVPMPLVDSTGSSSGASVSWTSDNLFSLPITDAPGNVRMMRGYLDDMNGNPTTVSVSGLPSNANGYNIYLYADGSNGSATRTGSYKISGTGITTSTITLTDSANTNFSGTFTLANNSAGNYLIFTIPSAATGFTITATPGSASDGTPRAPLNAIQIVPLGPPTPDFSISASPSSVSVVQGSPATYNISTSPINGFTGSVTLSASGLPSGATASFSPPSVTAGSGSTLTITTQGTTPVGSSAVTVTGTSGSLSHGTAPVTLTVTAPPDFSVSVTPSSVTVSPGGTATYTVSASALNGFTGSITLSANNLPSGATGSFNPSAITPGITSTLTITTTSAIALGSTSFTVGGTSGSLSHNSNSATLNVAPPPDFSISATPPSFTVNPGGKATYTVSVSALNGFTGSVNLSASGLPSGATASFTPVSITPGTTSTLTVTTTSGVALGSTIFNINGSSGSLSHSTTATLVVSATPDFTLGAAPPSTSVVQGVSATYTVSVAALNGFSGSVTLSASGQPSGSTASFAPASISPGVGSTLTITTSGSVAAGSYTVTITGTSGSITHTVTVSLTVTPSGGGSSANPISINFVGRGTAMSASETAGVVPETNWNQATGATNTTGLHLVDSTGASTAATVTWKSNNVWSLPITDAPGNVRMMEGYLDTSASSVTTVTVASLPAAANGYTLYVYADGDNGGANRSATYQVSGSGVTTTSITLTDSANSNFSGSFTQANNSAGNYVVFSIPAGVAGFTLSATPGAASDGTPRAPLNAIQLVPSAPPSPDFSISATPPSNSVAQGANSATFTVNTAALNGFSGSITLSASGLPAGATASFNPPSVSPGSSSVLTIQTTAATPVGNSTLTITGTSGSLSHSASVTFSVTPTGSAANAISVKFVGTGTAMASSEIAGVIPAGNWNEAGWLSGSANALVNGSGTPTTAAISWTADGQFALSITDTPGNPRMMRGYLDNTYGNPTTLVVTGLPADSKGYTVYLYADGSNGSASRSGIYKISGTGITSTSVTLTDAPNTDFNGAFTQASGSAGNYVVFTVPGTATGFTITATPSTASDATQRAPVNAMQIIPN